MALEADTGSYSSDMAKAGRDTQAFGKSVDGAGKKVDDFDAKLGRAREGLGLGVAAGTVAGLGLATKAASDLREAQAAANIVFGESSAVIQKYAEDAAQAIGLSKKEALDATGTFGNFFAQMGVGQEEAARLSMQLTTLGADFASRFNEADATRVIEAQTAAFRGEYDALQRYVPTINAAAVEQQALAETGKKNADSLTMQEKALAAVTIMTRDAGASAGDFARSNGSAATEAKKAAAETKNAAASIGEALLPVAAKGAQAIGALAGAFGKLPGPVQTGVVGLGGMTAAVGLLGPKLMEGAQLLKLGAQRSAEYGRSLLTSSVGVNKFGSAVTAGIAGLLAYNTAYGMLEEKTRSGIDTDALAKDLAIIGQGSTDLGPIFDQFGGSAESMADKIQKLNDAYDASNVEKYGNAVTGFAKGIATFGAGGGITDYATEVGKLKNEFKDLDATLASQDPAAAATTFRVLTGSLVEQGVSVEHLAAIFPKYYDELDRAERAAKAAEGPTGVLAGAIGQLASAAGGNFLQDAIDGVTDWSEATNRGADNARAFAEAIQSTIDVDAANKELADTRDRLADSERGLRDAYEAQADAVRSVADARESVADAERSLADAYTGVADARRGVTEAEEAAVIARENIVTATRELADAERAATGDSDEYRAAMQGVYDAEADLAVAQENSLTAQENLDQARQDYTRTLEGLKRGAEGAADGVIGAELRLRDAQESLATLGDAQRERVSEAQARLAGLDATATTEQRTAAEKALAAAIAALPDADDRTRAELAVRDAQRGVAEATERASDAAAEAARVEAAGVEGSDAVVAAREGVTNATAAEVDAQGNLEAAVLRVAGVQVDANGRVTIAQANLEAAIKDRVDADQKVIDARDAVIDAQLRVGDAVRGVRDANREVESALRGVRDANERVSDQKGEVVTARGEVETAERNVAKAVADSIIKYQELFLTLAFNGPVRTAMRNMTDEARDLVTALGGLNGTFTATVNIGGNAAGAILNGTTDGFEAVMGAVMGSPYAAPAVLVPPGKSAGGKGGGVVNGKPGSASDGLTIGTGPGPWTNPYGPTPAGYNKLGSAPVGTTAPTAPPSPFTIMGPLAPSWNPPDNGPIDYERMGREIAAALPHQGPLVNVEAINEGVGLAAVFQQAEFASRAA